MGVMDVLTTFVIIIGSLASQLTTTQANLFGGDDIEAHLNRLNKPAIKSITLTDGDIIDCVDIYKQPAFDHPLLKNHKIQMLPSFIPERNKSNELHMQLLWKENESCPYSTFPIRRVQKNDIIRATSMKRFGKRDANGGRAEKAGMFIRKGEAYGGAHAEINIWVPLVERGEWSHAAIELSNGDYAPQFRPSFIEAGWLVNPQLFGDRRSRLYVYWTADGYGSTGCYNILCPGFVQVSRQTLLGGLVEPVSVFDGPQFSLHISIYADSGKWWVVARGEPVGYWPHKLFKNTFRYASKITWGGAVFNTNRQGKHTTTSMGSGVHARYGWRLAAYVREFLFRDKDNNVHSVDRGDVRTFSDNEKCYDAEFITGSVDTLYYGGRCPEM